MISESIEVETFKNAFLGEGTDEFVKQLGLGMLNEGIGEFSSEVVGAWMEHAAQENIYGKEYKDGQKVSLNQATYGRYVRMSLVF